MLKRPFLQWFVLGYVGFIGFWFLFRLLFQDELWWLATLNTFAFFLFLPVLILLAIVIVRRRWQLLWAFSIPAVVFGILFGELLLPSFASKPAANQRSITTMSFNVLLGNTEYEPLVRIIREVNADIVGLQELTPYMAAKLAKELAKDYPYSTLDKFDEQQGSFKGSQPDAIGILSRFPIQSSEAVPLPGRRAGIDLQTKQEYTVPGPRLAIRATVLIDGKPVRIVSADLWHNGILRAPVPQWQTVAKQYFQYKAQEVEILRKQLADSGQPFLLLCDCNFTDTSVAYTQMKQFARDSFHDRGWGLGHTTSFNFGVPTQRIDYIWYSPEFVAVESKVWHDLGSSDHLPIITKLQWQ